MLEIVLDILEKVIHDSQNVCVCLTLNEMHIEWTSLIIYLINGNHTNTSSTHPPEQEEKNISYSEFINFVYLNRNFHLLKI